MTRLPLLLSTVLLAACMSLPGSNTPPNSRYLLTATGTDCDTGSEAISLSVTSVNAGLDSDRIARLDAGSGQLTYLKDVRWADELDSLLQQRLATDLECRGYAVTSGHRRSLGQPQLLCEVRAFNLLADGRDQAEVSLSCLFRRRGDDRTIITRNTAPLTQWTADAAVAALSEAYREALDDIVAAMR